MPRLSLRAAKRKEVITRLIHHQSVPHQFLSDIVSVIWSWVKGLGIPLVLIAFILLLQITLGKILVLSPFTLLFLPILISSIFGGFYSGMLATVLGAVVAAYIFLPALIRTNPTPSEIFNILMYIIGGVLLSYIVELQRRTKDVFNEIDEQFRLLFTNTKDYAIIFLDPYGYITKWNIGAQKLFQYKETEVLGKHFSILFTPQDQKKNLPDKEYKSALRNNRSSDENLLLRKDNSEFWGSGSTSSLWDSQNNIRGFVKIVRNMTGLKEVEKQKEDFISVASHELKTPVASMQIYTQLLQKYYKNNPPESKEPSNYLSRISSQLRHLQQLMNTLLDMSQVEQKRIILQKEPSNLTKLVNAIIESVSSTQKTHKIIRHGFIRKIISVDQRRIEEVVTNLLTNAIKYSPGAKEVLVSLQETSQNAKISVKDFGIGIPKDKINKVFDRFYRASEGENYVPGMGLGLYISQQIMKAHGGSLSIRSTVGKGSTFTMVLPIN
ncbi:MAG TPA: ATP-binding protein [Candidatus Saccharimonadales bacterium]|nr:ATP-binding protein [Candidatus Saccharimonadales bacterium]